MNSEKVNRRKRANPRKVEKSPPHLILFHEPYKDGRRAPQDPRFIYIRSYLTLFTWIEAAEIIWAWFSYWA